MHLLQPDLHSRRAFLRRSAQLGMAGTALPFALNLAAVGEAAAFTATDYKALVCVFLYGGNDYANTVINYDATSHAQYAAIRGGIAIPRADLAATVLNPVISNNSAYTRIGSSPIKIAKKSPARCGAQ